MLLFLRLGLALTLTGLAGSRRGFLASGSIGVVG